MCAVANGEKGRDRMEGRQYRGREEEEGRKSQERELLHLRGGGGEGLEEEER